MLASRFHHAVEQYVSPVAVSYIRHLRVLKKHNFTTSSFIASLCIMGWPWECGLGLGLGQLALALSGLALLTSLACLRPTFCAYPRRDGQTELTWHVLLTVN